MTIAFKGKTEMLREISHLAELIYQIHQLIAGVSTSLPGYTQGSIRAQQQHIDTGVLCRLAEFLF